MCSAHHLRLSTSEISDVTASMPSLGYFALQHRVAPPRKAYSLTSSAFLESGTTCPFLLFTPVFRGSLIYLRYYKSPQGACGDIFINKKIPEINFPGIDITAEPDLLRA